LIASHVVACNSCEEALERLDNDDTLVVALRRHVPRTPPADESVRESPQGVTGPAGAFSRLAVGHRIASDELVAEVGRGGMGVVYKARQVGLNRLVALKVALPGQVPLEARNRFHTEGEAIARLEHPNIVRVYECGEEDGQPYFSMELVEGQSFAQKLSAGPLLEREAAELVQTLARAVAFAHQKGVIHRDLKPANVLIAADGAVKLTDFGLAKLLDAELGQTQRETVLGTASYMAPEQARGDVAAVGKPADVYALGAILYEALAGRPPFRAETRVETLQQVQAQEPIPPSRLSPCLEAVCLKCLEKDPGRRYPSAAALAEDLARWAQGRPTLARPVGPLLRCCKAMRRRPVLAAAALACVLGVVCGLAFFYFNDPDKPIRKVEAQLARGRKTVLIGETGGPAWSRWRQGGNGRRGSVAPGGTFTVSSWGVGLLELVRDPQWDHYRLHAEVKHEKSAPARGEVGVYCAGREFQAAGGPIHFFTRLTFNDIVSAKGRWDERFGRAPPGKPRPPRPKGNKVFLAPRLYAEWGQKVIWNWALAGANPELFQPAARPGGPWRRLEVEVTPEAVRAWWGEDRQPVGVLTAQGVVNHTTLALTLRKKMRPDDRSVDRIDPGLVPRGSLGLVISESSASFCRVVVEPLGAED
jgi:serine/threonine-protein kinase